MVSFMSVKINKINISGRILTEFGCSLLHTFELSADSAFMLEFTLPDNAAVNDFWVYTENGKFGGTVRELCDEKNSDFSLKLNADGNCVITCRKVFKSGLKFEVRSAVMLSLNSDFCELKIPLTTACGNTVRSENERLITSEYSGSVRLDLVAELRVVKHVYSSTHVIGTDNRADGLHIHADAETRGDFSLRLNFVECEDEKKFRSTAYISQKSGQDMTGVYLFSAEDGSSCTDTDYLFIFEPSGVQNASGRMAAASLKELIKRLGCGSSFLLACTNGDMFSERALRASEISETDYKRLSDWIYSRERTEEWGLGSVLDMFENKEVGGEVVFVTCLNNTGQLRDYEKLCINVLSVSDAVNESGLKLLAENSGGIYARVCAKEDYERFIDGFCSRLYDGRLKNLKILEYASGTYFNMPDKITCYRMGDIIAYTFRSVTDYPNQLFLEADGGFSEIVRFENIIYLSDDECSTIFAKKVFDALYGYIASGDIAPETVSDFKKQAEKLSLELGVVCPETAISAGMLSMDGKIPAAEVIMHLGANSAYDEEATVLADSVAEVPRIREKIILSCVNALLCYMRSDYSFAVPYKGKTNDLLTAYAAAAIREAAKSGALSGSEQYAEIAARAAATVSELKKYREVIYAPDNITQILPADINKLIESNDIIGIAQLVLSLCRKKRLV